MSVTHQAPGYRHGTPSPICAGPAGILKARARPPLQPSNRFVTQTHRATCPHCKNGATQASEISWS
jgi:hypothetical protein